MSAGFVAAAVRARGLVRRRLGVDGIGELGEAATVEEAVAALSDSPYGRYVRRGMTLFEAERAVSATVLWHLRILTGWGPALSATSLRMLAGPYEIENIEDLILRFSGATTPPPFELGSVALSWPRLAGAGSAGDLRERLGGSTWGDPGSDDLGTVRIALRLSWASRTAEQLPFLRQLVTGFAGLVVARANVSGVTLEGRALEVARRLLGPDLSLRGPPQASAKDDLSPTAPAGMEGGDGLWAAEAAWWSDVESTGSRLANDSNPSESMVVGVVLLLAADAWRTRGALEVVAARGAASEMAYALA
jgi:hypothetical protein